MYIPTVLNQTGKPALVNTQEIAAIFPNDRGYATILAGGQMFRVDIPADELLSQIEAEAVGPLPRSSRPSFWQRFRRKSKPGAPPSGAPAEEPNPSLLHRLKSRWQRFLSKPAD